MPRKSPWNGPTKAIRVPEHCADELLAIARFLDSPDPDWYELDELLKQIKGAKHERSLKAAGIPVCKPKTDPETIALGLAEGWIVPKRSDLPCPLLAGVAVGDRVSVNGAEGNLVISDGPGEGDRYVAFRPDNGLTQVFNRRLAADVQRVEVASA